jgi:hypothetical protein
MLLYTATPEAAVSIILITSYNVIWLFKKILSKDVHAIDLFILIFIIIVENY